MHQEARAARDGGGGGGGGTRGQNRATPTWRESESLVLQTIVFFFPSLPPSPPLFSFFKTNPANGNGGCAAAATSLLSRAGVLFRGRA